MNKSNADFAIQTKDAAVARIGKSVILQPKVCFSGGSVKWYADRLKAQNNRQPD